MKKIINYNIYLCQNKKTEKRKHELKIRKMMLNQNKPAPIKNVRTNKTFLARFGNINNNNSSFETLNKSNSESPIKMKCLNELPKTKVINNKKSSSEVSPPLIETRNVSSEISQNIEEISIISHHSSTNSKDEEVFDNNNFINNKEDKELDILTIYGNEEIDSNAGQDFKKVSSYFHEAQVLSNYKNLNSSTYLKIIAFSQIKQTC